MPIRGLRNAIREQFGLKVFAAFFIVVVVLLTAYTGIGAFREWRRAQDKLREQGEMLADLLSQNVVVGLFAEDDKLLQDASAGMLGLKDVTAITIYNSVHKVLYSGRRSSSGQGMTPPSAGPVRGFQGVSGLEVVETADSFQFSKSVSIGSVPEAGESLYFDMEGRGRRGRVIGYAQVVLSKDSFHKDIASLVARNAVMMLLFIAAGWVIISFAVKQVTRPLRNLTGKVRALELGLPVEPAAVETQDEIGKLAAAFNAMVEARVKAEKSLRESEERERHLIATDLHDFVGQNLVASQYQLGALRKLLSTPEAAARMDEVRELIAQTIQYTRSLTIELRSPVLEELGLQPALESLAESYESTHGVPVRVEDDGLPKEIGDETGYLLFRSVRELLMNVVKHAKASEAKISLTRTGDNVRIAVMDNGIGFTATASPGPGHSFGLFTIRERLRGLGGRCDVESAPGAGTTVILTAPLVRSGEQEKGTA
jgi:signal transduction histidine kinase